MGIYLFFFLTNAIYAYSISVNISVLEQYCSMWHREQRFIISNDINIASTTRIWTFPIVWLYL